MLFGRHNLEMLKMVSFVGFWCSGYFMGKMRRGLFKPFGFESLEEPSMLQQGFIFT